MPTDQGTIAQARSIASLAEKDLAEAERLGPDADDLKVHLRALVAANSATWARASQRDEELSEAETREREALDRLSAARAAHAAGSLDRAAALELRDDLEHAEQIARIRQRETELARVNASAPYQAIIRQRNNHDRDAVDAASRAVLAAALRGRLSGVRDASLKHRGTGAAKWWPMFAARVAAQYPKNQRHHEAEAVPTEELSASLASLCRIARGE